MRKLYFLLPCILMLSACSDSGDGTEEVTTAEPVQQASPIKNGGYVDGINFNPDSVAMEALIMQYTPEINSICATTLTLLVEKNKREASSSSFQKTLVFDLSKGKTDSLRFFGITPDMISASDESKPVYLLEAKKNKGAYVMSRVNIQDCPTRFPVLFAHAKDMFMQSRKPKLSNLTVTGQTTKAMEYSAEFSFADEQSSYVYFTVKSDRQKLKIELNKNDD